MAAGGQRRAAAAARQACIPQHGRPTPAMRLACVCVCRHGASVHGVNDYPSVLTSWIKQSFKGNATLVNRAIPGTPSQYMTLCLYYHVPQDADIVVVEYNVSPRARLRRAAAPPSRPAQPCPAVLCHRGISPPPLARPCRSTTAASAATPPGGARMSAWCASCCRTQTTRRSWSSSSTGEEGSVGRGRRPPDLPAHRAAKRASTCTALPPLRPPTRRTQGGPRPTSSPAFQRPTATTATTSLASYPSTTTSPGSARARSCGTSSRATPPWRCPPLWQTKTIPTTTGTGAVWERRARVTSGAGAHAHHVSCSARGGGGRARASARQPTPPGR